MGALSWLITKLKNRRFAIQNKSGKNLLFGTIYKMGTYRNWKHDMSPLIFVMYSGPMNFVNISGNYTDGINLNYLSSSDKMWLANTIYMIRKSGKPMNGRFFYKFLKMNRPNIIRTAYRRYHTSMINGPKMVSAGITNLDKMAYPFNDLYIQKLNKMITPSGMVGVGTVTQTKYNPTDLNSRINQAQNSSSINSMRQTKPQSQAPWIKSI